MGRSTTPPRWKRRAGLAVVVGAIACIAQLVAGPIHFRSSPVGAVAPAASTVRSAEPRLTRLPATELIAHATLAPPGARPHESSADFPDPFVLRTRWGYLAYATNNRDGNVPIRRSEDLQSWSPGGDALPKLPSWAAAGGTWAPAVLPVDGQFVMYVTLHTATGRECIATGTATNPLGPFRVDDDVNRACIVWDAIDPSPFVDTDGTAWLLYKVEAGSNRIVSQRLTPDALSLTGPASVVLQPTLSWENGNVEGPSLARRDGLLFLLFSANDYRGAGYRIGYATCATPAGPCQVSNEPFLTSSAGLDGPGGAEWVRDGAIATEKVAFAAWQRDPETGAGVRALHVIDTQARVTNG